MQSGQTHKVEIRGTLVLEVPHSHIKGGVTSLRKQSLKQRSGTINDHS